MFLRTVIDDMAFTKEWTQMVHDTPRQLLVQLERHKLLPGSQPQTLPTVLNGVPNQASAAAGNIRP